MKADIAVVGGGSAGVAAAISAARSGADVVLIERGGMLGGMASLATVHSLCGLYLLRGSEEEPLEYANPGFPRELAEALINNGGARGPLRMGRLDVLIHQPAALASLAENLVGSLPNLRLALRSEVLAVCKNEEGEIAALGLQWDAEERQLETAVVIDTTGDADIAWKAGAASDISLPEKLQRPAYVLGMAGVDPSAMSDNGRLSIAQSICAAVTGKRLHDGALGAAFRSGVSPGDVFATIDLQALDFDPRDRQALASLKEDGKEIALRLFAFLKGEVEGFSSATVASFPERLGVRESRRIRGRYQLTESDVLGGARFGDEVAVASWPIELRETAKGPRFRFPEGNRACGIPLRSLRSRDVDNLYMAGRCISASHEAQAAIRVVGTCLATGEAAGKAAADHASGSRKPVTETSDPR